MCTKIKKNVITKNSTKRRCARGTAEIETILAIPILLFLLVLAAATLKLGAARMLNIFQSNELSYRDATVAPIPQYSPSAALDPIDGITSIKPGLPSRMHVGLATADIDMVMLMKDIAHVKLSLKDQSAYTSPAWAYSGWPNRGDLDTTEEWFRGYADEVRGDYRSSLGLSNAWEP